MSDVVPVKPAGKPEPRVWVAYRESPEPRYLMECYVRTAEKDALRLAVEHDLKVAHVLRSADLVQAVRDE